MSDKGEEVWFKSRLSCMVLQIRPFNSLFLHLHVRVGHLPFQEAMVYFPSRFRPSLHIITQTGMGTHKSVGEAFAAITESRAPMQKR